MTKMALDIIFRFLKCFTAGTNLFTNPSLNKQIFEVYNTHTVTNHSHFKDPGLLCLSNDEMSKFMCNPPFILNSGADFSPLVANILSGKRLKMRDVQDVSLLFLSNHRVFFIHFLDAPGSAERRFFQCASQPSHNFRM